MRVSENKISQERLDMNQFIKYNILFSIFFCWSIISNGQVIDTTKVFTEVAFFEWVSQYHPVIRRANLLNRKGLAYTLKARGGFEPKFFGELQQKSFDGKTYYTIGDTGFKTAGPALGVCASNASQLVRSVDGSVQLPVPRSRNCRDDRCLRVQGGTHSPACTLTISISSALNGTWRISVSICRLISIQKARISAH